MKTWLFIILSILLGVSANGLEVDSLKASADIQGGTIYSDYIYHISNPGSSCKETFRISVPVDSQIAYLKDEYGDANYQLSGTGLDIHFPICLAQGDERTLLLKFKSRGIDKLSRNYWRYVFEFYPQYPVMHFEHILKMPEGVKPTDIVSINPPAEQLDGERISYLWKMENLTHGTVFIIKYKQITSYLPYYIGGALLLIILTAFGAYYAIRRKQAKRDNSRILEKVKVLNEKEKAVIEIILKEEGINQSLLKKKVELTKSNLSKIVSKLELRGLIEKKSEGKINRLYLGEKLKKP